MTIVTKRPSRSYGINGISRDSYFHLAEYNRWKTNVGVKTDEYVSRRTVIEFVANFCLTFGLLSVKDLVDAVEESQIR